MLRNRKTNFVQQTADNQTRVQCFAKKPIYYPVTRLERVRAIMYQVPGDGVLTFLSVFFFLFLRCPVGAKRVDLFSQNTPRPHSKRPGVPSYACTTARPRETFTRNTMVIPPCLNRPCVPLARCEGEMKYPNRTNERRGTYGQTDDKGQ